MPAVRDKGFEDPVLHHSLHGAYGQAQDFGRLAGADVGLETWVAFHGGKLWAG